MNTRTTARTVEFRHAFTLAGLDGVQPPGLYYIERDEALQDTVTFTAYRHLSTSIQLHNQPAGIMRTATVDPDELEKALLRDAAGTLRSPEIEASGAGATVSELTAAPRQPRRFTTALASLRKWISMNTVLVLGAAMLLSTVL